MKVKSLLFISALSLAVFCASFQYFLARPELFWQNDNGSVRLSDFGYYLTIVRGVWAGDGTKFYIPESHLAAISKLVGVTMNGAMPIGATPTAFLFFLPFALIPVNLYALSIGILNTLGIVIFGAAWVLLSQRAAKNSVAQEYFCLAAFLIILLSVASRTNFLLGQLALFASGLLSISYLVLQANQTKLRSLIIILCGLILSVKIHYFAIFVGLLIGYARTRELFLILCTVALASGLSLTVLGPGAINEYLGAVASFSAIEKPALIAGVFASERMIIFKTVFSNILGLDLAGLISSLSAGVLIIVAGYFSLLAIRGRRSSLPALLITGAYLLFTPHMGSEYEDLLLSFPIFIYIGDFQGTRAGRIQTDFVFLFCFIVLNASLFLFIWPAWMIWFIKLAALALLIQRPFSSWLERVSES